MATLNQQRKNSEYWKIRFELLEARNNQSALEYYTNLEKQYRLAAQNIQKEMDSWFMRYATNNQISMSEARKILTGPELKDFRMTLDEYISKGKTLNYSQEWAKQLEKASTLYHVERYQALMVNVQQQIEVVTGNELDSLDEFLSGQYKTNYYQSAFEIQKGFGVGFDLMKIDDKKVANLIKQPWTLDARTFSDRIWADKKLLVGNVDKILTQGMISGEGYVKTAKKLQDAMGTQMYKAKRIVVTESAFFSSRSQQDCFSDLGVKKYEIVATLDSKTSSICQTMDGKVFEQKYFRPGVTASPFHCNCRTFQAPYWDDEFDVPASRAARGEDGKTYHVPADMKYPDWEKSFVNGGSKDGLDALKGGIIKQATDIYATALSNGLNSGKESLFLTDQDGALLYQLDGEKSRVVFDQPLIDLLNSADERSLDLVHNHPGSSSFSLDDIEVANQFKSIKEMGVIGHDGTKYTLDLDGNHVDKQDLKSEYDQALSSYHNYYQDKVTSGKLTSSAAWKEHSSLAVEDVAKLFKWKYERKVV